MTIDETTKTSCSRCFGIGTLEATDLFCGAGGSSLGLEFVCCPECGRQLIQVTQALNHDTLAVEAHNENFPHADHDVHNAQVVPASRFRRTPILWASPDCTHHAYCRGRRLTEEVAQRSRMTFYDVARFTEYHRYDVVMVENVVEARLWCDTVGHGDKCNCGSHFESWYQTMTNLGYEGQIVYFNSQFALPTPQSRDRMYVVFWRRGLPAPNLDYRPVSWCSSCTAIVRGIQTWKKASSGSVRTHPGKHEWGRYGAQYLYHCPDCDSAVAPAVVGARSIIDWSRPTVRIGDRPKPLAPKTRKRIKTGLERLSTTKPVTVQVGGNLFERQGYARVWSVDGPLRTITTTPYMGLVVPNEEALIVRAGGQGGNGRGAAEPMQTVIGTDRQVALVVPNRENGVGAGVDQPMKTITTAPAQQMLVQVNRGGEDKLGHRSRHIDEPTAVIAGHGEFALVSMRNHGAARSLAEPAETVVAGGNHHGLLVYNGMPGFVRDLDDAAGTITSRDKQSLLVPYYSNGVAKPLDVPVSTVSTRDREALVITESDIDDCHFRMLQWPELLAAQQMHRLPDGRPYKLEARRRNQHGKMVDLSNEMRVKFIGNAVSSPVATLLGSAVVEVLR